MNYKFFIACVLTLALIIVGINRISTSNLSERKYSENSGQITTICEYLNGEQFKTYDIVRLDIFDSLTKINCSKKDDSNGGYVLSNHGFLRIIKEYNYMYFQTKGSFNESVGLIYSPVEEPDLSGINAKKQILKKLKTDGWYYNKTIYD